MAAKEKLDRHRVTITERIARLDRVIAAHQRRADYARERKAAFIEKLEKEALEKLEQLGKDVTP